MVLIPRHKSITRTIIVCRPRNFIFSSQPLVKLSVWRPRGGYRADASRRRDGVRAGVHAAHHPRPGRPLPVLHLQHRDQGVPAARQQQEDLLHAARAQDGEAILFLQQVETFFNILLKGTQA
jgi:hypothetical protein